mgnify:FL=1
MQFDPNRVAWSLRDSYYRLYASSSGICLQTLEDRTKNRNLFFMENTEEADVHVQEDRISIISERARYAWTFIRAFMLC